MVIIIMIIIVFLIPVITTISIGIVIHYCEGTIITIYIYILCV